jgi:HSP20 family protein
MLAGFLYPTDKIGSTLKNNGLKNQGDNKMNYYMTPTQFHSRMAHRMMNRAAYCESDRDFSLAVNIHSTDDEFVLTALVPGLKAEDLNIQILEDVVTIEGEYKQDETEYLMRELPFGSFRRSLRLPSPVDAGKADARIVEGVLTLTLPKAESAKPRTIKIAAK